MLNLIANHADYIIAAIQVCLTANVLPTVWHQSRAKACSIPLVSSVPMSIGLAALGAVFLALGLYVAMATVLVGTAVWAAVALQRKAYGAPQVANSLGANLKKGDVVIIKKDDLTPEFHDREKRQFRVSGEFGMSSSTDAVALFGEFLHNGEKCWISVHDIECLDEEE